MNVQAAEQSEVLREPSIVDNLSLVKNQGQRHRKIVLILRRENR